jgi:hypothetical protein
MPYEDAFLFRDRTKNMKIKLLQGVYEHTPGEIRSKLQESFGFRGIFF